MNRPVAQYELCFRSLYRRGRGFAFPCDPLGHVDLGLLSANGRDSFLRARSLVGKELGQPAVRRCETLH